MVRRLAPQLSALAACSVLAATGCATTTPKSERYLAPIHMQAPESVAWEPAGPYELKLVVFNGTRMGIEIVAMRAQEAQVKLFREDGSLACKTPNPARKTYEVWWTRKLPAGKGQDLKFDVHDYCPDLKPGVYRYEAIYVSNPVEGAVSSFYQGVFGPETGRVLVRDGATKLGLEELRAAFDAPAQAAVEPASAPAATPAEPAAAAQPAASATATTPAAAPAPAAAAEPDEPALSPKEIRACVDRELAARGLNAYGDPKGTVYDGGAPVDEYGRILYVASRNPGIRRTCGIPKF